jgi:O-antigen/teichoic acid export membrane protein
MQFSRTVARNSAFAVVAQLSIKLLAFGFSVVILRHLGAEAFGQYAGVLAFGAMFVFIADLGLGQYVVREVARLRNDPDGKNQAERLYGDALRLRLLLSVLAACLVVSAAWLTGRSAAMIGAIALGSVGLILYSVQGTSDAILAGFERLDLSAGARIANQLVFIVAGAAALYLGFGYYGLVVANLLGVVTITWICWRAVRRLGIRPLGVRMDTWLPLVRASLPFGIIGLSLGLSYKFDSLLLNVTRSDVETGYYSAAYNLVFSAAILSNAFNTALFPSLTRRAATSEPALARVYGRSLRYLMLAAFPIAVGTSVLADRLVPVLYTIDYLPAVPALQLVIWAVPLMFLSEFLGYMAIVQNRERTVARAVVLSTGLNILVNLALVPRFGFLAAAAMTVATECVLASQYIWMLRHTLSNINWWPVGGSLVAALVMGGVLLVGHDLPLIALIALGALSYAILLVGVRVVVASDLTMIRGLRHSDSGTITWVGAQRIMDTEVIVGIGARGSQLLDHGAPSHASEKLAPPPRVG